MRSVPHNLAVNIVNAFFRLKKLCTAYLKVPKSAFYPWTHI